MTNEASVVGAQVRRTVIRRNVMSLAGSLVVFPLIAGSIAAAWSGFPAAVVAWAAVLAVLIALLRTDKVTLANGELRSLRLMGLRRRRLPVAALTVEGRHRSYAGSSIRFSSANRHIDLSLFRTRDNIEWYPRDQIKNLVLELDLAGALVEPSAWELLGYAVPLTKPMPGTAVKVRLSPIRTVVDLLLVGLFPWILLANGVKGGNPTAVAALVFGSALLVFVALRLLTFNYVQADGPVLRSVKFNGSSHTFPMSSVHVRLGRWLVYRRIEFSSAGDKFSLALMRTKQGDAWPRRKLRQLIDSAAASGAEVDQDVLDFLDDA